MTTEKIDVEIGQNWRDIGRGHHGRVGEVTAIENRATGLAARINWSSGRSTWVSVYRLTPPCYELVTKELL